MFIYIYIYICIYIYTHTYTHIYYEILLCYKNNFAIYNTMDDFRGYDRG